MASSAASPDFAEAHAALLRNGALQFDLPAAAPPAPAAPAGHLSLGFGSVDAVWLLAGLGAALVVALAIAYRRGRPPLPDPAPAPTPEAPVLPPAAARLALGDADRLAAAGRHLEAARALLACGLDAIGEHHPGLLRPTTTARDIAREARLGEPMRLGFGRIARAVEKGLFGGRSVDAGDYAECRRAFLDAAFAADRRG